MGPRDLNLMMKPEHPVFDHVSQTETKWGKRIPKSRIVKWIINWHGMAKKRSGTDACMDVHKGLHGVGLSFMHPFSIIPFIPTLLPSEEAPANQNG